MTAHPLEDRSTYFSVDLRVEAPLSYSDDADYISKVEGTFFAEVESVDESPDRVLEVGTITAFRIYGGRALNDRYSLWDICDACEQVTADAYRVLFEHGDRYKPVIQEMFPDALSPDVLLIDLVRVDPTCRGRHLGLLGVRRLMDIFEPESGLVLVKPFPLQFNAHHKAAQERISDLAMFTCGEAMAFDKLRRYWERLGFHRIPMTDYFALTPATVTPSLRDVEAQ